MWGKVPPQNKYLSGRVTSQGHSWIRGTQGFTLHEQFFSFAMECVLHLLHRRDREIRLKVLNQAAPEEC